MIKEALQKLNEDEDIEKAERKYPTHDADVNLAEVLAELTTLGYDDNDEPIPGYVFAEQVDEMYMIPAEELVEFALDNGFLVYKGKIMGEELPADIFIIGAVGVDEQLIKDDFLESHEVELELEPIVKEEEKNLEEELAEANKIKIEAEIKQEVTENDLQKLLGITKQDFYTVLGWITRNISEITMKVPTDVETVFKETFGETEGVSFINIKKRPEAYSVGDFNKRAIIKLVKSPRLPKALKSITAEVEDGFEIRSFELAKGLVKNYFFNFGKNNGTEIASKIEDLIKEQSTALKEKDNKLLFKFVLGYNLIDIKAEEEKLVKEYNDKSTSVSQDIGEWLKNNVTRINIEVPDFLDKKFVELYGSDVVHNVVDTSVRDAEGRLKKWGISASVGIKTLEGMPPALLSLFKEGKTEVSNKSFGLALIRDFGPDFFINNRRGKNKKEEPLDEDGRKNKKGIFVNKDAGDVEKNLAALNHALGNNQAGASSGVSESVDSFNADSSEYAEFEVYTKLSEDSKAFEKVNKVIEKLSEHRISLKIDYVAEVEAKEEYKQEDSRSYCVARLYGGLNGEGEWLEYFDELEKLFEELDCWLISLINDPIDDLFTLRIGFDFIEKITESLPNKGESKVDFISRFMKENEEEYPNPKQRYAVALNYWEKK